MRKGRVGRRSTKIDGGSSKCVPLQSLQEHRFKGAAKYDFDSSKFINFGNSMERCAQASRLEAIFPLWKIWH